VLGAVVIGVVAWREKALSSASIREALLTPPAQDEEMAPAGA